MAEESEETPRKGRRMYDQVVKDNASKLSDDPDDKELTDFFDACFQAVIEERRLYPAWACLACQRAGFGEKPAKCPHCSSEESVFAVGTFQGRGAVTGTVFQHAAKHVLTRLYPDLGLASPEARPDRDHCDLHVPGVVGIELKGSPKRFTTPTGEIVELPRPGMMRSDTEKKAASNATTYKQDNRQEGHSPDFYVLTNAVPDDWQEDQSSIDRVYDVMKRKDLDEFAEDIRYHKRVSERPRRKRRGR